MCSTLSNNKGWSLDIERCKEALKDIKPPKNITVFVLGIRIDRHIKRTAIIKEHTGILSVVGVPYFVLYSVGYDYCKILEVSKDLSFKEMEVYLKRELGGVCEKEYLEIAEYFRRQTREYLDNLVKEHRRGLKEHRRGLKEHDESQRDSKESM